jgi:hypothetical protein
MVVSHNNRGSVLENREPEEVAWTADNAIQSSMADNLEPDQVKAGVEGKGDDALALGIERGGIRNMLAPAIRGGFWGVNLSIFQGTFAQANNSELGGVLSSPNIR